MGLQQHLGRIEAAGQGGSNRRHNGNRAVAVAHVVLHHQRRAGLLNLSAYGRVKAYQIDLTAPYLLYTPYFSHTSASIPAHSSASCRSNSARASALSLSSARNLACAR